MVVPMMRKRRQVEGSVCKRCFQITDPVICTKCKENNWNQFKPSQELLTEAMIDIAMVAGTLVSQGRLIPKGSRKLVNNIKEIALEFEKVFDSADPYRDYMSEVIMFAEEELIKRNLPVC